MSGAGCFQLVAAARRRSPSRRRRSVATWPPCTAPVTTARRPGDRFFAPDRARRSTASCASTPSASSAGTSTPSPCSRSASRRSSSCTCSQRSRARCRSTRRTCRRSPPLGAFNVAVSFMTNTNWQWYAGELDDEPPDPDGRAHGAELRLGRRRHGGRRGDHPRHRPARPAHARQLLGRPHPHDAARCCCRCRSSSPSLLSLGGVVQNFTGYTDATPLDPRRRRRGQPVDPRRPGRQPGRHQAARHERRRLLQRQLGPPVREPDRHHQLHRDVGDPGDPVRLRRDVRRDGRLRRGRPACCSP